MLSLIRRGMTGRAIAATLSGAAVRTNAKGHGVVHIYRDTNVAGISSIPRRMTCTDLGLQQQSTEIAPTSLDELHYGKHLFKGATAAPYLAAAGLSANALEDPFWCTDGSSPDKVAAAVLAWARDNNASVYCHWFQPIAASGVRHGLSAQVQNDMFEFDEKDGKPKWKFSGKDLLRQETDGSSYPNGGLRATHQAGAYITLDPSSPMFIRDATVFIPAAFVSFYGLALDEKTPLLRASDALSVQASRLLNLLDYKVSSVSARIGLEQELFLVPKEAYSRRPDLQMTGRTVMGRLPPRGQEMNDHYMAPISTTGPTMACLREIQDQCFKMGIPLKTRHREVAPNQYEFAPLCGSVVTQIDQNVMVMQVIEEVADKHGLAALLQEKPFHGVNGSGKHNNWSLVTDDGTNLLNVKQLEEISGSGDIFPVIMAAIIKAIDKNGDLMRLAIASPGNDFRLGACEAPPSIISTYLGKDMTDYLEAFAKGKKGAYNPTKSTLNLGSTLPPISIPAEDRNRTSPFPYGGHRFEFRAVGSSQNVSLVNTVLATICAKAFKEFADAIEVGAKPLDVAQDALKEHWKVIFNGNGYDTDEQDALIMKGLCCINSNVDAISCFTVPKNVALFEEMKVFTSTECQARQNALHDHYSGVVETELATMIDMILQHVIPACKNGEVGNVGALSSQVKILQDAKASLHHEESSSKKAALARIIRLETMMTARLVVDAAEAVVPANLWTLSTYKELLLS